MDIQDLNANSFADMFKTEAEGGAQKQQGLNFGMQETEQDIFNVGLDTAGLGEGTAAVPASTTTDTDTPPPDSDTNKTAEEIANEKAQANAGKDVDILGDGKVKVPDAKKVDELKGLSDYFQSRVKDGKFVGVNNIDENGKKIPFVPKTIDDFDEVIDMQVTYKLEQAKKDLDQKWYEEKSPAWKAVSQYAEMVDDPAQLIPFLQGVRTIQSVATFNENEIDGAEQIMRVRLEQAGDTEEVIAAQIEALKAADKLISTAKIVKPAIIHQEQQALAKKVQEENIRKQNNMLMVNKIRENAYKAIEQPFFGKQKLKREEKAAIYDLIGQPADGGYAIFNEIDNLFEKANFEKLAKVALLLTNEEAFYSYLGTDAANKTAAGLQRKLQLATDSHSSSGNDFDEDKSPTITKNPFKKGVSFGRSE